MEYVDLGLSVKWATCNVGASKPEELGDFFAWGEVEPKDAYSWASYRFGSGEPFSKYQLRQRKFLIFKSKGDGKIQLDPCDDVAAATLGGSWRMPTIAECKELKTCCSWTWTTVDGVHGCKVQSLKPGYTDKWIFLPAAGFRDGDRTVNAGAMGYYWSSTGSKFYSDYARFFDFDSIKPGTHKLYRFYGRSVRPVCGE